MDTTTPTHVPEPAPPPDESEAARIDRQVRAIMQSFRVVYGTIQAHSHRIEQQCGVSSTQLWAMWEIADAPGLKVTDLALTLSVHPSNCSNMIDKLRRKGLIRKQRSGPDQRVVRLYVTPDGLDLLATAPLPTQGILMDALGGLPRGALTELENGLDRLLSVMKLKVPAASMKPVSGV